MSQCSNDDNYITDNNNNRGQNIEIINEDRITTTFGDKAMAVVVREKGEWVRGFLSIMVVMETVFVAKAMLILIITLLMILLTTIVKVKVIKA